MHTRRSECGRERTSLILMGVGLGIYVASILLEMSHVDRGTQTVIGLVVFLFAHVLRLIKLGTTADVRVGRAEGDAGRSPRPRNVADLGLRLTASLFVAFSLCVSPAFAQVRAGIINPQAGPILGSPVQVESCGLEPKIPMAGRAVAIAALGYLVARANSAAGYILGGSAGGALASGSLESSSTLIVQLANEGNVQADLIRIHAYVTTGDVFERDITPLLPGDVANVRFTVPGAVMQPRVTSCSIDLVHFVDGSTWSAQAQHR